MNRFMIAIAALAALSACGSPTAADRKVASLSTAAANDAPTGSGEATGTTVPSDPAAGALLFAKCMRDHGIDMADPVVVDGGGDGKGGVAIQVGVGGPGGSASSQADRTAMDAANKDCQHFMSKAGGSFTPPSPEEQAKQKEEALAFTKCMREHGIDMPDPTFSDDGGMSQSMGSPTGSGPPSDVDQKAMQDASKACGQSLPGFGITTGTAP